MPRSGNPFSITRDEKLLCVCVFYFYFRNMLWGWWDEVLHFDSNSHAQHQNPFMFDRIQRHTKMWIEPSMNIDYSKEDEIINVYKVMLKFAWRFDINHILEEMKRKWSELEEEKPSSWFLKWNLFWKRSIEINQKFLFKNVRLWGFTKVSILQVLVSTLKTFCLSVCVHMSYCQCAKRTSNSKKTWK